jgi:DNA-binding response OmpR family regulator
VYISRETIGTSIWSSDSEVAGRTIEQHVYKLRKKLQLGVERGVSIRTAYGQGYRLELSGQQAGALPAGAEPGPDVPA